MCEKYSLLIHPRPKDDESTVGYLLRLADENELHALWAIHSVLKIKTETLKKLGAPGIYRLLLGESLNACLGGTGDRANSVYSGNHKLYGQKRVCPVCLSMRGYMRAEWLQPLVISCQEHRVRLVDHCDQCGKPLNYILGGLFRCNCGRDLRQIPALPVPDWLETFYSIFAPWRVSNESSSYRDILEKKDNEAIRLLRNILNMGRIVGLLPPSIRSTRIVGFKEKEWDFIGEIILGWPLSFSDLMGKSIQKKGRRHRENLELIFRETSPPEVFKVVEPLMRIKHELSRRGQIEKISSPLGGEMISLNRFCQISKMGFQKANELFDSGGFSRAAIRILPSRTRYIGIEELHAVEKWYATSLSIKEGAQIIKCKPVQLGSLISAAHIPASRHIYMGLNARVRAGDLMTFLKKLQLRAFPMVDANGAKLVPLTAITVGWKQEKVKRKWTELMEAIRKREVPLYELGNPDAGLGNFAVLRDDLERPRKYFKPAIPKRKPIYRPRAVQCS